MAANLLCYQLPAIISEGTAIIVSPLIALMKNQVDLIRGYSSTDNIAHFINSQMNKAQITQVKKDITNRKCKLLYVAPESLVKQENIDFLKTIKISLLLLMKRTASQNGVTISDRNIVR